MGSVRQTVQPKYPKTSQRNQESHGAASQVGSAVHLLRHSLHPVVLAKQNLLAEFHIANPDRLHHATRTLVLAHRKRLLLDSKCNPDPPLLLLLAALILHDPKSHQNQHEPQVGLKILRGNFQSQSLDKLLRATQ